MRVTHRLLIAAALGISVSGAHAQIPVVDATTENSGASANPLNRIPSRGGAAAQAPTRTQTPAVQAQNAPMVRTMPLNDSVSAAPIGNPGAHLVYEFEALQQEVQQLRGMVEELSYNLERMRQDQRDRYLDLDRRLSLLNQGGGGVGGEILPIPPGSELSGATAGPGAMGGGAGSTASGPAGANEEASYQAAFNLIRDRRYDDAINGFMQFTRDYPNGSYAGNAYYWLGEVYLVQGNHDEAQKAFGLLLNRFPGHAKLPDAKYKLGRIYLTLGDTARARTYLDEVVSQHPGTSAAQLAETELRNLRQ